MLKLSRIGEGIFLGVFLVILIGGIFCAEIINGSEYDTIYPIHSMDISVTPAPLLNINSASRDELITLSGIGEALAERIIEWRTVYGPFTDIEQIMNVQGIGESKFEEIRDLITIK